MFHTKNKTKTSYDALADKFNHKKTIHNDNKRFQNISAKSPSVIKVSITDFNNNNDITDTDINMDTNTDTDTNSDNNMKKNETSSQNGLYPNNLFNINSIKKSVNIDIHKHFTNDAYANINIPKIMCKEILVPTYLESDNFDFTMINKNITTHMGITFEQKIKDASIDLLHEKGVKVINNVYQEIYKDKTKPTGFGDFIRGCYYLLQFCYRNKFEHKIFIYSPIAQFLINHCENYNIHKKSNQGFLFGIPMFVKNNWVSCVLDSDNFIIGCKKTTQTQEAFIRYLCHDVKVFSNNIFTYNIMFPEEEEITKNDINHIKTMLQPTGEMSEYVDLTLGLLRLEKNKYNVIHIRSGDKFLCDDSKIFATNYIKKIVAEVFLIFNTENNSICEYLLVADNNEIKVILMEIYPNIKSVLLDITHLGVGSIYEIQKVKNSMLDFYLLADSCAIHSLTSYPHGSGFSYWCAKTYNIPYSCKYITA